MASLYRKAVVLKDRSTGEKIDGKSKKWWGRYRDFNGRDKRVPLSTDKPAAQVMLANLVRRAEREKAGIFDPTDAYRTQPILQHLPDYQRHLEAKANSPRYVATAIQRVKTMITGCGFRSIADLSASKVVNWLLERREAKKFGISTSNLYLISIKGFCNWLVRDGRLSRNPFAHLQGLNAEMDIRRQRRVLAPDELHRLIQAAETSSQEIAGNSGRSRAMLYRLAAFTGLRALELSSLTARSFNLDACPPTVCIDACYSKRRRKDVLPLEDDLVEKLRTFLSSPTAGSGKRLWPQKWYRKAARMLRHDLAAARQAWIEEAPDAGQHADRVASEYLREKDQAGRVADFHSLRHSFISYLVIANVPPKVTQTLARHSTVTLTLDRYAHLGVDSLVNALKLLPSLSLNGQPELFPRPLIQSFQMESNGASDNSTPSPQG